MTAAFTGLCFALLAAWQGVAIAAGDPDLSADQRRDAIERQDTQREVAKELRRRGDHDKKKDEKEEKLQRREKREPTSGGERRSGELR